MKTKTRAYYTVNGDPSPQTAVAMVKLVDRSQDLERSTVVRKHTKDRGKHVTTRWRDVAQELYTENLQLRAENERRKKAMQWYENRLASYAGNA